MRATIASGASILWPAHSKPATRATSRNTAPLAQSLPRATMGTSLRPSASSSRKPRSSSSTLMDSNSISFAIRNSLVFRQLEQPGCQ